MKSFRSKVSRHSTIDAGARPASAAPAKGRN